MDCPGRRRGTADWHGPVAVAAEGRSLESGSGAFEREDIRILNDPVMIGELVAYQAERLPSGLLRYGAPR